MVSFSLGNGTGKGSFACEDTLALPDSGELIAFTGCVPQTEPTCRVTTFVSRVQHFDLRLFKICTRDRPLLEKEREIRPEIDFWDTPALPGSGGLIDSTGCVPQTQKSTCDLFILSIHDRALPTETKVERRTSQSRSGTSVN